MYYIEFETIIKKIVYENLEKDLLLEYLMDVVDCEKIYDSEDEMVTDIYFTLKHYACGEEDISKEEWLYFLECLLGKCEYSMDEKIRITTKPLT